VPELHDIAVYVDHLARRFVGGPFEGVRLASPFILRTAVPPISDSAGRTLTSVKRLGKRLVFELDRPDEARTFLVIHLMVAGRFRLAPKGAPIPKKLGLASLEFPSASVILTEAGTKRRASIHYVTGPDALAPFDEFHPGLPPETLQRVLEGTELLGAVGGGHPPVRCQLLGLRKEVEVAEMPGGDQQVHPLGRQRLVEAGDLQSVSEIGQGHPGNTDGAGVGLADAPEVLRGGFTDPGFRPVREGQAEVLLGDLAVASSENDGESADAAADAGGPFQGEKAQESKEDDQQGFQQAREHVRLGYSQPEPEWEGDFRRRRPADSPLADGRAS
jgi:hypothetical protein